MPILRKTRCIRKGTVQGKDGILFFMALNGTVWLQCAQSRCVRSRLSPECFIACCIGQLLTHAEVVVVLTTVY